MTLSVWQRTIVNDSGDVLGSATVTVRRESDNALATLYDNPAGTGSPLSNPLTADSAGFAQFYVIAGVYRITAASGSFSAVWRHVQLGTAQSVESDQNLRTTDTATFAGLWVDNVTIDGSTIGTATGEDLTLSPQGDVIIPADVDVTGDVTVAGDITFTGALDIDNLRLDGSTISTTTTGDNLELAPLSGVLTVDGDVVPKTDGTNDLGSPSLEWQNLYIDGTANIDSLVADTADIDGGTIDNTVIGGTIAAAGTFTSVDADYIDLATSTSPVPADAVGRLRWDQDEAGGTLMLGMSGGNVVQPVGEAQYYWVKASSAITKGQVIMASGVVGMSGKIEGAPATGLDKDTGIRVIGIAAESISIGEWGLVTSFGYVRGVNTNAFNANDILYLNPSVAGGLTNAMPAAPNPKVIVALVVVKDATNGELLVRVSHGQTFGSFATDAQITSPSGNDFLVYDGTDNRWENYTAANARTAMGLGTIATQDANNVNIDGGSIDGTTIGASTRAAGNFTTLDANGNVTLGDASTDTVTIAGPLTTTAGNVVINESGGDFDFRVESDTNTHALFVQGSDGNVGIETSSPAYKLDVVGAIRQQQSVPAGYTTQLLENTNSTGYAQFQFLVGASGANGIASINYAPGLFFAIGPVANDTTTPIVFRNNNNTERLRIDSSGNVGIGTSSPNANLAFGNAADIAFNTSLGSTGTYAQIKAFNTLAPTNPATNIRFIRDVASVGNDGAICFDTVNTERLRIDSSGNVGLGVTPSAWGSQRALEFAYGGLSIGSSLGVELVANTYWNGSNWIYRASAASQRYEQDSNGHKWYTAPSGIAGDPITFTERLSVGLTEMVVNDPGNDYDFRIESDTNTHAFFVEGSSGNVGIGTSSSASLTKLTVYQDSTFAVQLMNASQNYTLRVDSGFSNALVLGNRTSFTDLLTISTSGNVGIGTTSPSEKLEVSGNIKTSAPSGGTAAAWKLGTVATVSPILPNRTIEVEINGTTYYLHAKTTND